MIEEVVTAWQANHRVNLELLTHIDEDGLLATLSKRGGRSVARQFAHLHNNRIWHLEKRARQLADGAHLFATADEPDRATLIAAHEDSTARIERLFVLASEKAPGARVFKRGVVTYLAYFVAHDSHHRGNILLTLKQCGHPIDKDARYRIWDWDRI